MRFVNKDNANRIDLGLSGLHDRIVGASELSIHMFARPTVFNTGAADNNMLATWAGPNASAVQQNGFTFRMFGASPAALRMGVRPDPDVSGPVITGTAGLLFVNTTYSVGVSVNLVTGDWVFYVNGATAGSGNNAFGASAFMKTATAVNNDCIGGRNGETTVVSTQVRFQGNLGEVAVWTAVLPASAFVALYKRRTARKVHPHSLRFYMPLLGNPDVGPERCQVCGLSAAIAGSVPKVDHVPIIQ